MNKTKIGLSLATSYLSNNTDNEVCRLWNDMFGKARDFLKILFDYGVTSIEINNLHMEPPIKEIAASINTVIKAGYEITIHLFLPNFGFEEGLPKRITEVIKTLDAYEVDYSKIPMTVHGHSKGDFNNYQEAIDRTIIDLNYLMNHLDKVSPDIKVALEICRDKDGGPVGVDYSGVLNMVEMTGNDKIGICWDMGHTLSNIITKKWENKFPSELFLEKVVHTHIHDVDSNQKTHGPLNKSNDTLNKFIKLLKNREYDGVYNLELYPERWDVPNNDIRMKKLLNSVTALKELIT